jgi:hypothetical protein
MKKFILRFLKGIILLAFVISFSSVRAERTIRYSPLLTTDYLLSVQNLKQTAPNKLEFDVYLLDTDPTEPFILNLIEFGFLFNSGIYTGGIASVAMDNTTSQLNPFQALYVDPILETNAAFPNQTLLSLASFDPVSIANRRTTISQTANGTLITHLIITNTIPFVVGSTPNLVFCSSAVLSPYYPTIVTQWISPLSTILVTTPGTNAIVNGNPVLIASGINQIIGGLKIDIYSKDKSIFVNCPVKANQIYIYDTLGSLIITENNVAGLKKFDMNNDPVACYFIKVVTDNHVYSGKVLLK